MQWVPRDTGTPGWQACGDYIVAELRAQGWQVEEQVFPYREVNCRNIIRAGAAAGRASSSARTTTAAATPTETPTRPTRMLPVPAANDGASGVAVLLELARVARPEAIGREVWLAAFDAEDNGDIDGWEWMLDRPTWRTAWPRRRRGGGGAGYDRRRSQRLLLRAQLRPADPPGDLADRGRAGLRHVRAGGAPLDADEDHTWFLRRGYRAVDIIDFDYPHWHTVGDTLDKISAAASIGSAERSRSGCGGAGRRGRKG